MWEIVVKMSSKKYDANIGMDNISSTSQRALLESLSNLIAEFIFIIFS
ncbi:MAG: hypothetical protein HGA52_00610 [Bacteroidales bacterium]|nr:hypothetical protein [Bacteroidales bacterium]